MNSINCIKVHTSVIDRLMMITYFSKALCTLTHISSRFFSSAGLDGHAFAGNAMIDTQHQGLFDGANDLRAAIRSGSPVDEVDATIDALIRDVVQHFQDEEAFLVAADYPGTAKHAALHRELLNSAVTLVGRFRAGTLGIGKLFQFLAHDILTKHMLGPDGAFVPYVESRR